MGRGTWSWIVPDGLWDIAKPLIPELLYSTQGGGKANSYYETVLGGIIYL
ncbi:IS5/IS1182 family transposase, partial [Streptomyces sp. NPDC059468]